MKIFDISQEVFSCVVFPGDPAPKKEIIYSLENGDICNLSSLYMCSHNGTHIDAPAHFLKDGKTVEEIDLSKMVGMAYIAEHNGIVEKEDAIKILKRAEKKSIEASRRILIKGDATISEEAAEAFAQANIYLIGNESQTVGPKDAPMKTHKILLSKDIVLLEGIRLNDVCEGEYLLNCAPLSLAGADGSPCRAILIQL